MKDSRLSVFTSALADCVTSIIREVENTGSATVRVSTDGVLTVWAGRVDACGGYVTLYDRRVTAAEVIDDLAYIAQHINTYGIDRLNVERREIPAVGDAKIAAKERGLQNHERMVLQSIPIDDYWPVGKIAVAMANKGRCSTETRKVHAICRELVDKGLARADRQGHFQRTRKKEDETMAITPQQKASVTPITKVPDAASPIVVVDAMGDLADIAKEVRAWAASVANTGADLAAKIEAAAIRAEEEKQIGKDRVAKLEQLGALLKSLGLAAA